MKTIEERIRERIEKELRDDILELFKPICNRIESVSNKDRQFWIEHAGEKRHWMQYVKALELVIFSQEIDNKVDKAIESFMDNR